MQIIHLQIRKEKSNEKTSLKQGKAGEEIPLLPLGNVRMN